MRRHQLIPTEKRERQYDGRDKKRTGSRQKGVVSTLPSPHSHPELGPGHSSAGFLEGFKMKGTLGLLHSEFPMADSIDLLYSTKPITHTVLCLTPRELRNTPRKEVEWPGGHSSYPFLLVQREMDRKVRGCAICLIPFHCLCLPNRKVSDWEVHLVSSHNHDSRSDNG